MELVRLFWRELCTDLCRSKNEISPGHSLEFRLNFCPSSDLTWSQTVVLAARNVLKHTHLPFIVTQCELSSLCSEKGDNKIPTDIWLTEWFSSLFLKVATWGVCLLAFLIGSFNANIEQCKHWTVHLSCLWNTINCCRAVKWGIFCKIILVPMTVSFTWFLLLLSYRSITSSTLVLILLLWWWFLTSLFVYFYLGSSVRCAGAVELINW